MHGFFMDGNLNISCDISPRSKAIKGYWICVYFCKWRRTIGSMPSSRLLWILSLSRSIGSRRPTAKYQNWIKVKSNMLSSQTALIIAWNRSCTRTHCCTCSKPTLLYYRRYEKNSKRREPCELVLKIKARPSGSGFVTFAVKLARCFLELFSSFGVCSRQVSVNPNFHKHLQETAEEGPCKNFDTSYWARISLPNQACEIWRSIFVILHQDSLLGHRRNGRRHILYYFVAVLLLRFLQAEKCSLFCSCFFGRLLTKRSEFWKTSDSRWDMGWWRKVGERDADAIIY